MDFFGLNCISRKGSQKALWPTEAPTKSKCNVMGDKVITLLVCLLALRARFQFEIATKEDTEAAEATAASCWPRVQKLKRTMPNYTKLYFFVFWKHPRIFLWRKMRVALRKNLLRRHSIF